MHQTRFIAVLLLFPIILGKAAEATRPNILFILADDLGYGDLWGATVGLIFAHPISTVTAAV